MERIHQQLVLLCRTPTTPYIEILEASGQVGIRRITCSIEDAREIYRQLGEVLHDSFENED